MTMPRRFASLLPAITLALAAAGCLAETAELDAENVDEAEGALHTSVGCDLGESRVHEKAAHVSAYSHTCLASCDNARQTQIYTPPHGWALKDYKVVEDGGSGIHGADWTHYGSGLGYISEERFAKEREIAAEIAAIEPQSGVPLKLGASYKARKIEEAHARYATTDDTVSMTAWAKGRDLWRGSSRADVYLDVTLECIGTLDDYRAALQAEIEAAQP